MARTRKSKIRLLKGVEISSGDSVWVYSRHSPAEDQTIFSQRRDVEKFVGEHELVVAEWFIDEAKTPSVVEGRGAFESMLSASKVKPPPVKAILVWDLSRFSRDHLEAQFYTADLRLRGYQLVSNLDDMTSGEMGMILETLITRKGWPEPVTTASLMSKNMADREARTGAPSGIHQAW